MIKLETLARMILVEYYEGLDDPTETPHQDEITAMVEMTQLWLDNDCPGATIPCIAEFMFDNRRV